LSVTHKRHFLSPRNFVAPYHGFLQSIFQRTVSGGLYFYLQGVFADRLDPLLQVGAP
jgi:hypothetical protein